MMATMTTASAGAAVATERGDFHEASDDDMVQPAANDTLLSYVPRPARSMPRQSFPAHGSSTLAFAQV